MAERFDRSHAVNDPKPSHARCLFCKAADPSGYCGRPQCPYLMRSQTLYRVAERLPEGTEFSGPAPSPFVGRYGYPKLNVGILAPVAPASDARANDDPSLYDHPRRWAHEGFAIPQVVDLRSSLLNSRFVAEIKGESRMLDIAREVATAARPVDLDIELEHKPAFSLNVDMQSAPHGPNASLKAVELGSNPRVDPHVEKAVSDTDQKAADALSYLYDHAIDENALSRILSVGTLGIARNRKLVPTRWSITAVDDTLGKERVARLRDCSVREHMAFFGSYLGNYYLFLVFPGEWSYELFEAFLPDGRKPGHIPDFATDFEGPFGRKDYAHETAGGYYAARLPAVERLLKDDAQASVLALRFITEEYSIPLGVWVVREAARRALNSPPLVFGSRELMLKYALALVQRKFSVDARVFFSASILLRTLSTQAKLSAFG